MELIASVEYDLAYSPDKMSVRIYKPIISEDHRTWSCLFEIDDPIGARRLIYGESSLQALLLSIKTLSAYLYGSEIYKRKELGIYGEFGADLGIPATHLFLKESPFPF